MTPELAAFLDESRKPIRNAATRRVAERGRHYYVVAAAVVLDGDVADIRSQLEQVGAEVGVQLHYRNLSVSRRAKALEAIDRIGGWDGYLFETARPLPDQLCGVDRETYYRISHRVRSISTVFDKRP